ncbi:YxeA family protein [Paenibacillus sp. FSL H7-0756]|uniref:YxeA family protein n=1 Tax=Paenibacillus sp. FSL H7-0756 TaxID=2954738 RepID=UPI0030F85C97
MKKGIIAITAVVIVLAGLVVFLQNINLNRIGAQPYYVQINQAGKKVEETLSSGQKYVSYEYTQQGYDSKGKERVLVFTAAKELRKDAYLRIYVKNNDVSSYQEVQGGELPEPAKQKLESAQK